MKTYGLLETRELLSILTLDDGTPRLDTVCPSGQYHLGSVNAPWNRPDDIKPDDYPEDMPWTPEIISHDPADYPGILWTPPAMAELVKLPRPDTAPGQTADPFLVWTETSVTRDWEIRDMTPTELADSTRKTWATSQDFLAEFTMTEMGGIGVSQDATIAALRLILSTWVGQIYSDDPRVVLGLNAIEAAGILTAERRAQIVTK